MTLILLTFGSFLVAAVLSRRLCDPASKLYILDQPNVRSLHEEPTPRGGGLAILAALAVTWPPALLMVSVPPSFTAVIAGLLIVALISFWDDRSHVHPLVRLVAQVTAATALILAGLHLETVAVPVFGSLTLGWTGVLVGILYIVWFVNLYNFMDGMDGFAGGMAAIGFSFLSVIAWGEGENSFALLALLVAAANLGFLTLNFPPARIFMGDVGSASLGFLAAAFSLWGERREIIPLWASLLIFSPFLVDATVTLIRRVLAREKVWQAHRSHYYQRLVRLGWGHRKTVLSEYALMLATGISAVWLVHVRETWILAGLVFWAGIYTLLAMSVHRLENRAGLKI